MSYVFAEKNGLSRSEYFSGGKTNGNLAHRDSRSSPPLGALFEDEELDERPELMSVGGGRSSITPTS